ncbi:conserved hypothetical protein (plasmid) [Sinorhizobium fredii NGR234]|uniref:Uncharacterized protein n=1 Tax=Sinorhizobium fredii (strain NBRC 101917 / NGR234) TaxID=394 RepID=C3KN40_SINFN|nr:hypothetical protein [Sinorhizobium fredii]ACP21613.1 conserved hypothetical protein [Sinorhizobium fredii NGR234]
MKTPWKFLAQLTSRRPSTKAQESSIRRDTDPKAHESDEKHRSALRLSLKVAASPPAHEDDVPVDQVSVVSDQAQGEGDVAQALRSPIDAEKAQATTGSEADTSGGEANCLAPKSVAGTKSQSKPRIKRRERRNRANPQAAAQSAVAPKHQRLQPLSSRDLFFREATTLDEDIKMLRIQLAQKLHLQNGQLTKMLERFDVP